MFLLNAPTHEDDDDDDDDAVAVADERKSSGKGKAPQKHPSTARTTLKRDKFDRGAFGSFDGHPMWL